MISFKRRIRLGLANMETELTGMAHLSHSFDEDMSSIGCLKFILKALSTQVKIFIDGLQVFCFSI